LLEIAVISITSHLSLVLFYVSSTLAIKQFKLSIKE